MVKTLDEFEKGRIPIPRFGAQVVIDVFDVLHCGAKNAPFLFFCNNFVKAYYIPIILAHRY